MMFMTRRRALLRAAAIGGAVTLSSLYPSLLHAESDESGAESESQSESESGSQSESESQSESGSQSSLPQPARSGIEHVVVLMMENRSFDHFLGWLPDANGKQAGLSYPDRAGHLQPTHHLAPDYQGCGFNDPDHSFEGGRVEYDNGRCDGWLRAGTNDVYSIGYYTQPDLAFLGQIAPRYATPDHYFAAILGPTFPNRIYQHAGQTDRLSNTFTPSTLPTIWDRLAAAGISRKYYFGDIPFLALWGAKYLPISHPYAEFLADAAAGTLPAVSYVDGEFLGELTGTGNDDHPHVDIRRGEHFMDQVYKAVTTGPGWKNTVLVINFDEWGGFFDHVPPTPGPTTPAERALGYTDGLRGFRVPCLVISPWSQGHRVPHAVYDHTSVLKMIEWRYGLAPLAVRDAAARNLAEVLDFAHPRLGAFQPVVPDVVPVPCADKGIAAGTPTPAVPLAGAAATTMDDEAAVWRGLQAQARTQGWAI